MLLEEILQKIRPLDRLIEPEAQQRLDSLTKPQGSLGKLEDLARCISVIQAKVPPRLGRKLLFVFAADHGITEERVIDRDGNSPGRGSSFRKSLSSRCRRYGDRQHQQRGCGAVRLDRRPATRRSWERYGNRRRNVGKKSRVDRKGSRHKSARPEGPSRCYRQGGRFGDWRDDRRHSRRRGVANSYGPGWFYLRSCSDFGAPPLSLR